jgi:hypothetical protein
LTSADHANPWLAAVYFFAWLVYFVFAATQFYQGSRWWTASKASIAVLLSQALTISLLMGFLFLTSSLIRS